MDADLLGRLLETGTSLRAEGAEELPESAPLFSNGALNGAPLPDF